MSETTPNNKSNKPLKDSSDSGRSVDLNYELITSYIDNEIHSEEEKLKIKNLIESNPNYYNRYLFEKLTKEKLQKSIKSIETPVYIYKDIGLKINNIIENSTRSEKADTVSDLYLNQIQSEKSYFAKYLKYGSAILLVLITLSFILFNFFKQDLVLLENDIVAVSSNIFNKIDSGKIEPSFKINNTAELTDSMNKYVNFKVFVPELKNAVLVGGICNEMYGVKIAHFVYKKGNDIVYTLQANKDEILNHNDKLFICDEFKDNVNNGKNWFPCIKDKNYNVVIWYKDQVICASVSHLKSEEISSILTNYK